MNNYWINSIRGNYSNIYLILLPAILVSITSCIQQNEYPVLRINHVMLYVSDIDSSVAFYQEVLDLQLHQQISELVLYNDGAPQDSFNVNIALLRLPGSPMNLELAEVPGLDLGVMSPHFQHIGIGVANIDAYIARLEELGIELTVPKRVLGAGEIKAKTAFFNGPDGESIELMEILSGDF